MGVHSVCWSTISSVNRKWSSKVLARDWERYPESPGELFSATGAWVSSSTWAGCGAGMPATVATSCSPLKSSEYEKIRKLAYDTFGLDLRTGKETLVSTRLAKQIRQLGHSSFNAYYEHVVEDSTGRALVNLIDALTTNHTSFFREEAHFDFLRKTFLPE